MGGSDNQDMVGARTEIVTPFRELLACRQSTKASSLPGSDKVPEIVFTGEISHGEGFEGARFGVACSWKILWDEPWSLLEVTRVN